MENENEAPSNTEVTESTEVKPETPEVAESSPAAPKEPVQLSEEDQVRKRIDKIVWQREEARREAEHWKKMAQTKAPETKQESVDPNRPDVNDPRFKSYDEYTEALADWKVQGHIKRAQEEFSQRTQRERMDGALKVFNDRVEKTREKYPDYDDLFERAPISEAMAPTILESDKGPELAVYLAKNPDVARKLYNLGPREAARELGKIEAKLDDLLQPKVVSDAKPPLSPVKPKGDLPDGLDDKIDIKVWMKRRNKQIGR
jgi:hypothetical protein